ncbi:MAG: PHB depolymerase family esterase [Candidatus Thermoplasmatota archaeon]
MRTISLVLVAAIVMAGCLAGTKSDNGAQPTGTTDTTNALTATEKPVAPQEDALAPTTGAGQPIQEGNFGGSLVHDGVERTYELHVPPGLLSNQSIPLMLVIHPALANAAAVHGGFGFDSYADEHGFIIAYPDGTREEAGSDERTWNAMHCCGVGHSTNVDDVGFLLDLIAKMRRDYPLDAGHIGLVGHSNGAMLAHRFAATHSELVSSVTAVGGTIGGQEDRFSPQLQVPDPSSPVSVQIIHAYDDPIVTYYGGPNRGFYERNRLDTPVRDSVDFWRDYDGATEKTGSWSDNGVDYETYRAPDGTEVDLVSTNGGHGWPGSGQPIPKIVKVPPFPHATLLAVEFFLAH